MYIMCIWLSQTKGSTVLQRANFAIFEKCIVTGIISVFKIFLSPEPELISWKM